MNSWVWGIIGVLLALLGLGIPVGYGIKSLLQNILTLLKNVNSLVLSVQVTISNVNNTVNKMSEFIDRNEQQHAELRTMVDNGVDRLNDNLNNQSNRIVDAMKR